jgi:hypothetical protein
MDFETIAEALNNGELTLDKDQLVMITIAAATKDEHIDCNILRDVMSDLQKVKKTAMEDFKEVEKEAKKMAAASLGEIGKAYLATLNVGDPIEWISNGMPQTGTVGEQKEGAKRAHLLLNEIPANSTAKTPKPDRYVPFDKIKIPEGFEMSKPAEEVA